MIIKILKICWYFFKVSCLFLNGLISLQLQVEKALQTSVHNLPIVVDIVQVKYLKKYLLLEWKDQKFDT